MYKNYFVSFFVLLFSVTLLSSCGSKDSPNVDSIKLSVNTLSLKAGESSELTVSYSPTSLKTPNYTWSSSNESVVTVKDGKVTAIASGTATITVSVPDLGLSDVCNVTVLSVTLTSVTLNITKDTVRVGQNFTLIATVYPQNVDDKTVTWFSLNENVATVSSSGNVNAISTGTTNITATTKEGELTATCAVVVKPDNDVTYNPYGDENQWQLIKSIYYGNKIESFPFSIRYFVFM
jgi:uncharacterized protein YjdB